MLPVLTILLSSFTLLSAHPTAEESTQPPIMRPNEVAARYCPDTFNTAAYCRVITLAHGTTTGTIVDIDIYSRTCGIVGSARSQSYSKKAKVQTSLTSSSGKGGMSLEVRPKGMQGIMTPEVKYEGKKFGNDGKICGLDRDLGGWVCVVPFPC